MMNKNKLIIVLLIGFITFSQYTLFAQNEKQLTKVIELKIYGDGGHNGANVAWHPIQNKYYAAMAGNIDYPMRVFDAKGLSLADTSTNTLFDVRGFWYNPNTKHLQANGYNDFGWTEYKLDENGIPYSVKPLFEGMNQPLGQSVGVYDAKMDMVYFFDSEAGKLVKYSFKTGKEVSKLTLVLGVKYYLNDTLENLSYPYCKNTLIFNGSEIGLLNADKKQIELYDINQGTLTNVLKLPPGTPTETYLNFSFANDTYFIFDKMNRVWFGYK